MEMAERRVIALTLYSRRWCHLCDDMLAGLQALQAREPFELAVIDVDGEPALAQCYGERVPVLLHGERELCHYHLDLPAVTDYLRKIR
jgi:glutaredoxin